MTELGKEIAAIVKHTLEDKNQYIAYKVLFITKKEDAGLTGRTWKGKISEEL